MCNTRHDLRNKRLLLGQDFKSPNSGREMMCLFPELKHTHLLEPCLHFRGDHSQALAPISFFAFASTLYLLLLLFLPPPSSLLLLRENRSRLLNACEKKPCISLNFHHALMAGQPHFSPFSPCRWAEAFPGPYHPWRRLKQDGACQVCST